MKPPAPTELTGLWMLALVESGSHPLSLMGVQLKYQILVRVLLSLLACLVFAVHPCCGRAASSAPKVSPDPWQLLSTLFCQPQQLVNRRWLPSEASHHPVALLLELRITKGATRVSLLSVSTQVAAVPSWQEESGGHRTDLDHPMHPGAFSFC